MNREMLVFHWLSMAVATAFLFVIFASGPGPRDDWRYVGLGVAVFGLAGVLAARYTLGRSFSVTAKATELVTTGVYSRIRNPIYVFSFFFIIGVVTMVRLPILYVLPLALIPIQAKRARNEAVISDSSEKRGRPLDQIADLITAVAATVYEVLTERSAVRSVDRDTGKPRGEFHHFLVAVFGVLGITASADASNMRMQTELRQMRNPG